MIVNLEQASGILLLAAEKIFEITGAMSINLSPVTGNQVHLTEYALEKISTGKKVQIVKGEQRVEIGGITFFALYQPSKEQPTAEVSP
jgi:hypothetical protein